MNHLHIFKRLFQYVANYRRKLFIVCIISLVSVGFEVAKPLPIKLIIDNVLSNHPLPSIINTFLQSVGFTGDKHHLLYLCVGLMVFIAIFSFVLNLFIFHATLRLAQGLVFDLMIDFFGKLQQLSLSFYAKNKVGDLTQRMNGDVFVVYFLVAQIILPAITSVVCLGAMFYIMASIDVVLAFVAFSVVPLLAIVLAFFVKPMNDTTTVQYETQGLFSAFLQQSLSSMKIIQGFGRESFMNKKLRTHAQAFSDAYIMANRVSMTFNQLTFLITGVASAALILVGAFRGLNGTISIGDLFIFLGYIAALYGPVNSLITAIGASVAIGARGKRVFDILDSGDVVSEKPHAINVAHNDVGVEFKNVSFGYINQDEEYQQVLHNISFKVSPGQIVAIVGPTGTGKTSLISLLTRFYDPAEGSILFNGVDIGDLKIHSLREHISLVLQDPFIFPMTIGENIAFGNPEASFEDIINAAKGAQAHHFISKLPNGYDTMITEAGSSLSGGEKQRLAIARAFLKKAPVLIMDEPTSAMDALTEAKLFEALGEFSTGKTVFLISHRLSTIKHADLIITIKDGVVVEKGTHKSLLEENKIYAGLYKYQHIT